MDERWNQLREQLGHCQGCGLCNTRIQPVWGVGNPASPVLFVGEAPGKSEDEQGLPFVGKSGQLLDKMLAVVDLSRDKNIFITNIVKCRPPQNRDPLPQEVDSCIDYLRAQVKLIGPKIIVCLGRVSATRLIDPNFKVTSQHGRWVKKGGIYFMGTFHPAALLRNPANKPPALEDLLLLRDKILEICPFLYEL